MTHYRRMRLVAQGFSPAFWLHEAGERDVEGAGLTAVPVPLHEDRALVGPFDDAAAAGGVAVGDEEADGALHAEEARRGHRNRAREHVLEPRVAQAEGVYQPVEHAHEVVLGVVERL